MEAIKQVFRQALKQALAAIASFALAGLFASRVQAQTAAVPDDAVVAVRLAPGELITLDGSLSHPAWQRAPVWARFVEKDPVFGAVPPQATRVQVLFDDRALYVGVRALDTDRSRIRNLPVRIDQVNRTQDFVVVYVDAIGTKRSAQFFRVNAAGSMADGLHTAADDSEDFSPDFDWDSAVQHDEQGWTAVFRLPFASLRYADGAQQGAQGAWRFMVARRLPREQFHLITSVPIGREVPSFIHNLQPLVGVTLPESSNFITVRPSVTLRQTRSDEVGAPRVSHSKVDASLDVKWRPRAELVVDATLNPDFSQLALDVPQLAGNSRFALFFPEKRPFFFESADLLRSPTEAFYTRSFTQPRWGLRGTWRDVDLAGSALAVDDRGGGLVLLPGPYSTDYADQPASSTLAARARLDRGSVQFGGVLAARRYARDRGSNDVLGPDMAWQISDAWRVKGQWLASQTSALSDGHGSLARGVNVSGQRLFVKAQRQAEDGETALSIDESGSGFRHDTGFVNQVGVRAISVFQSKGWQQLGPFNQFYVNVQADQVRDRATGKLVKEVLRPGLWSAAARNLEWWAEAYVHSDVRTSPSAPLLHEHYLATGLVMTPATWFPLIDTNIALGQIGDTVANRVRPGGRWNFNARLRPVRALEVEPSFSLAWLDQAGQRMYTETATQLLAVWHFDARNNLRLIRQRTSLDRRAEPLVAASKDGGGATSLTYTWRRSAGTLVYIGASRSHQGSPIAQRGSEAFIKLQVDADDVRAWWR